MVLIIKKPKHRSSKQLDAMILVIQFVILLLQSKIETTASNISKPGCQDSCGGISIPYPFGIGPNCYMEGFEVFCREHNGVHVPFLLSDSTVKITNLLNISLPLGQARIGMPISFQCYNDTEKGISDTVIWFVNGSCTPFTLNHEKNKFTVIGCDTLAYLSVANDEYSYLGGCVSACGSIKSLTDGGSCSGVGCCQTTVPEGINYVEFSFDGRFNNSRVKNFSLCSYAMVVEDDAFRFKISYITTNELIDQIIPAIVNWVVGNTTCETAQTNKSSYACKSDHSVCINSGPGYLCNCSYGYHGNPYLEGGCQDIDECIPQNPCYKSGKCHNFQGGYRCTCPFGRKIKPNKLNECELNYTLVIGICATIVALLFLVLATHIILQRRNLSKVKLKYFQLHGGWILLEKIKSNQGFGFTIFTKQQVEQATNNFDSTNIIGRGGQGTVYRGTLKGETVAIKKCKTINERKTNEFGKEMLILSQISHKNIVKLLGCCLEVEVPMLVYEFIPNGSLFYYIHCKKQGTPISFSARLRIAYESAEALAYLHTSASPPIFHGDVKSANILLDENYTAKVSDFGASMLAPRDEMQLVTLVQGTCGYLDPEYIQSCQLTDKSDVYSFGVVLVELLTRKPVIDFDAPEEEMSLSSRFLYAAKQNKMQELIDDEIKNGDDMELIRDVADLATKCLSMNREERPMMIEVAQELNRITKIKQHPWREDYNCEETTLLSDKAPHDIKIEHYGYYFNIDKEAQESIAVGR